MKYSIVIPTYNEAKRIAQTIETISKFYKAKKSDFEIIVSDDKSTDSTLDILKKTKNPNLKILKSDKNYYKGWPVRNGIIASHGDLILMTDADLSTPISQSDKLEKAINSGFDLAIGSRINESGEDERASQPLYRRLLGKLFTYIRSILTPKIKDSQCGFKMFQRVVAHDLFQRQRIKNIIFDVEILYLAEKLHYKIAQVPVKWEYLGETRMRLTIKNAISTIISLAQIYVLHRNEK